MCFQPGHKKKKKDRQVQGEKERGYVGANGYSKSNFNCIKRLSMQYVAESIEGSYCSVMSRSIRVSLVRFQVHKVCGPQRILRSLF